MQEFAWEQSPYLVFVYPYQLEAYRSDRLAGRDPVAALIVVGLIVWVVMRRRGRSVEE